MSANADRTSDRRTSGVLTGARGTGTGRTGTGRTGASGRPERTAASAAPRPPYAFFHPRVVRVRRLSPSLLRIVLGGEELAAVVSGGRDQRFKLFLPRPGQDVPVLPDVLDADWYARWRAMDPAVRGVMRTYTIRDARRDPAEIDVDFALHGDLGPASRWARRAAPGDPVSILAPVVADNGGVDFRPPRELPREPRREPAHDGPHALASAPPHDPAHDLAPAPSHQHGHGHEGAGRPAGGGSAGPEGADWVLLTGDETALPAIAGILAWLPAGTPVKAWIEVAHPDDQVSFATRADADVTWLLRPDSLPQAVASAALPAGRPYAWLAGEAATVRALRRHLVGERGYDRRDVVFTGYWRQGATEDDLLAQAAAAAS